MQPSKFSAKSVLQGVKNRFRKAIKQGLPNPELIEIQLGEEEWRRTWAIYWPSGPVGWVELVRNGGVTADGTKIRRLYEPGLELVPVDKSTLGLVDDEKGEGWYFFIGI